MKPYFGANLRAGQCQPIRSRHFSTIAEMTDARMILEVGTWAGQSLVAWDEAAFGRAKLIVVDQWKPYFEHGGDPYDEMNRAALSGEIFDLFIRNIRSCGIEDRVKIYRGPSSEVLPSLAQEYGGLVDIVFVDGDHRYEQVKVDIVNSMTLVRTGGVLCGDDLEVPLSIISDLSAFNCAVEAGTDFVNGYHPGVTKAVAEVLGDVTNMDGLWAVRKLDDGSWKKL